MPDRLGGLERRATTSQATDAWGDEFAIVARCGVEVPGPSEDVCIAVETGGYAADWVISETEDSRIATTYGRNPAVEVTIPKIRADEAVADVLAELTPPVALADPTGRACVGLADAARD